MLSPSPAIRPVEDGDVPVLERIAAGSHRETRFYFDGGLSRERCDEMYASWIRRSCAGSADAVFVAGFSGAPAGYVTCHVEKGRGSIGLIAVDEHFAGHGLGRQLVCSALDYFCSRGVKRVQVVTQGRNLRSQRLYQRLGFVLRDSQVWYHLWPRRSA